MGNKTPQNEKMPNRSKIVRGERADSFQKKPEKGGNPNSFLTKNPTWRFQQADKEHEKWSIKNCNNFCTDILEKLISFEGQTWSEITVKAKKTESLYKCFTYDKRSQSSS